MVICPSNNVSFSLLFLIELKMKINKFTKVNNEAMIQELVGLRNANRLLNGSKKKKNEDSSNKIEWNVELPKGIK